MEHVLWLAGGCGAGKTSIAFDLAHRFDLQLYIVDAHGFALDRRRASPLAGLDRDERWLKPAPEELAERFVRESEALLPLIFEDLEAMRGGPLVIAEGPQFLPDLVADRLASPGHGLWLVPTESFQRRSLGDRQLHTSDAERAHRNRLARDAILNGWNREQAAARGLLVVDVDGALDLSATTELVAKRFAALVAAGPRARDEAERRRIRREENAAVHFQITAWRESVGVERMPEPPRVRFVCECGRPGCREVVELTADEFGEVLDRPGRLNVAEAHLAGPESESVRPPRG
jgi:hypothetical protein